mmetsp:Transcript_18697/g.53569  ORF Transcript_18697/g.53569 Transcript_18697/m.53569 type:complete len:330 (+) Transcript_18697:1257-2246(+)
MDAVRPSACAAAAAAAAGGALGGWAGAGAGSLAISSCTWRISFSNTPKATRRTSFSGSTSRMHTSGMSLLAMSVGGKMPMPVAARLCRAAWRLGGKVSFNDTLNALPSTFLAWSTEICGATLAMQIIVLVRMDGSLSLRQRLSRRSAFSLCAFLSFGMKYSIDLTVASLSGADESVNPSASGSNISLLTVVASRWGSRLSSCCSSAYLMPLSLLPKSLVSAGMILLRYSSPDRCAPTFSTDVRATAASSLNSMALMSSGSSCCVCSWTGRLSSAAGSSSKNLCFSPLPRRFSSSTNTITSTILLLLKYGCPVTNSRRFNAAGEGFSNIL